MGIGSIKSVLALVTRNRRRCPNFERKFEHHFLFSPHETSSALSGLPVCCGRVHRIRHRGRGARQAGNVTGQPIRLPTQSCSPSERLSNLRRRMGSATKLIASRDKGDSTRRTASSTFAEKIEEVDKKRLSDSEKTAQAAENWKSFSDVGHTLAEGPRPGSRPGPDRLSPA